jgi:hypothetical protein
MSKKTFEPIEHSINKDKHCDLLSHFVGFWLCFSYEAQIFYVQAKEA